LINKLKNIVRASLNFLHLDLTKNLKYDRLTIQIMKRVIKPNSNCIDVGCHKGEILSEICKLAPKGHHYAFEPIPFYFNNLKKHFTKNTTIYSFALSNETGSTTFQYVKNAPAYSGLKKRKYNIANPEIEELSVELKKLDDIIPEDTHIDLIKIDVEGAEFGVLKGAEKLLKRCKPVVIFEFGMGANNYYNTSAADFFDFINDKVGLKISTLEHWINKKEYFTKDDFVKCYNNTSEYYFIAHPQ